MGERVSKRARGGHLHLAQLHIVAESEIITQAAVDHLREREERKQATNKEGKTRGGDPRPSALRGVCDSTSISFVCLRGGRVDDPGVFARAHARARARVCMCVYV